MRKEPIVTYIKLLQNIGLGLMVGTVYWDQEIDQVINKKENIYAINMNFYQPPDWSWKYKWSFILDFNQSSGSSLHCSPDGNVCFKTKRFQTITNSYYV